MASRVAFISVWGRKTNQYDQKFEVGIGMHICLAAVRGTGQLCISRGETHEK